MYNEWYYSMSIMMITFFMFSYNYKHLLLTLISLEFMMVSIFYLMFMVFLDLESNLYLIIIFLSIVVCEGALGLSLVVLMVRFYGNDYINSLSILKW